MALDLEFNSTGATPEGNLGLSGTSKSQLEVKVHIDTKNEKPNCNLGLTNTNIPKPHKTTYNSKMPHMAQMP